MWKLKWIFKVLLKGKTYSAISEKLHSPLNFYKQIFLKLAFDKPAMVKLKLKTGKVFLGYRFMDLYVFHEIFIDDDYGVELEQAEYIVDIGGNKGYFSLRMSELFPEARIYCYEPEPHNYENLTRLIEENHINAEAYREGVAAESGELQLFINPKNDGGHSIYDGISGSNSISVQIVSLDTVMSRLPKNAKVDLMKLDCEGAEKDIILSITPEFARRIEKIYYEATHALYNPSLLNNHLESLGYIVSERHGVFKAKKPIAV